MTQTAYPPRAPMFPLKFIQRATDAGVANQFGPVALALLVAVVIAEDKTRCKRPINYFNHQLMLAIGAASEHTLIKVRDQLVAAGWLFYRSGGKGIPGVYWVLDPTDSDTPVTGQHADNPEVNTDQIALQKMQGKCSENDSQSAGQVHSLQKMQGKCSENDSQSDSPPLLCPNPIPSSPPTAADGGLPTVGKKTKAQKPRKEAVEDHPLFAEFWSAYPRKVKRKEASEAFSKINPSPELLGRMIAAVLASSKTRAWTKNDGEFVPYPATWLNGERWTDEDAETKPKATGQPTASFAELQLAGVLS